MGVGIAVQEVTDKSFAMPLGGCTVGGSGVDIFIESGDCDLELGDDSGGLGLMARAFLMADRPSGFDDRGGFACGPSEPF